MESQSTTLLSNPQIIPGPHATSFFTTQPFAAPVATYPFQVPVPLDAISFIVSPQADNELPLSQLPQQLPLHPQQHIFDPSLEHQTPVTHQDSAYPQQRPEPHYQPLLHVHPHVIVQPTPGEPNSAITKKKMKAAAHGPTEPDPHAAAFLRHTLGESKWSIFSARLFERRMGASRKKKPRSVLPLGGPYDQVQASSSISPSGTTESNNGASVVDFLVKVEAVKEILRNFVPHPYHPVKFMVHEFPQAPSGKVTLTRSTVLELSGWSNTQFSYWARRAEAVSVLATDDPRLGAVASALSIRLASPDPSVPQPSELDESEEGDNLLHVTGKGIDAIVEDVKKRTGKSQFLRGKHSGLEPFGTLDSLANGYGDSSQTCDAVQEEPRAPEGRLMPTFQAEMYTHTPPSPAEASTSTISYPVSLSFPPSDPPPTTQFIPELQGRSNTSPSGFPSRPQTRRVTNSRRLQTIPGQTEGDKDNATFPLSDSRFEVDPSNPDVGKRKRTTSAPESSRKRPRGMPIFIPSALTPTHATV